MPARRAILALALLPLLAAPALARTPVDWTGVVLKSAEGGFVMGNPKARVHVVEYASFTCNHCGALHNQAMTPLKAQYLAKGLVRFELRSMVRDALDLAAAKLARCRTPEQFYPLADRWLSDQASWIGLFTRLTEDDQKAIMAEPDERRLVRFARLGKLDLVATGFGFTSAQFDACLANPAHEKDLADLAQRARTEGVTGTPAIFINGVRADDIYDWPKLKAAIDQALAKK